MTDTIVDLRYLAESQPSLCIPRVFNNISEARIRQVFDDLAIGKIKSIDIVERRSDKGESFKRVYVHFDRWNWSEDAQAARKKLITGKEIKIVYDNPWFWKVSASKWTPSANAQERGSQPKSKARIEFEDEPRNGEFCRDLKLKKGFEERQKCDVSKEYRRRDDRNRSFGPKVVPILQRKIVKPTEQPIKIAPTLQLTEKVQENVVPCVLDRSEIPKASNSTPEEYYHDADANTESEMNIDYSGAVIPRKRKFPVKKAKSVAPELVVEDSSSRLSAEDQKICDELYGDL